MKTTNQNQNFVYQVIEEHPRRTDHQVNQPAVVNTKVPMGYVPDDVQILYGFDGNASDITLVENATSQQVFQSLINTENSTVYVY